MMRVLRRSVGAWLVAALATHAAQAQLTPDRTYYGVNRSVPMTVKAPQPAAGAAGAKAEVVEPVIELFAFGDPKPVASAHVLDGRIDMAALFPELWTSKPPRLLYAQLRVGADQIGSPVVLQPLTTPRSATLVNPQTRQAWFIDPATGQPNYDARKQCDLLFNSPAAHFTGIRAYVDQHVIFETSEGEIEFRMRPDMAPNTVNNLLELVRGGFYVDTIVHRVVPRLPGTGHPFVIQFGDPTGTGDGGPGYAIDLENSTLAHDFGVLSMARDDAPDTNGSQIFICLSREGTARLDGKYTSFAEAVRGVETILKLGSVKTDERTQRPIDPPKVLGARLTPAPPFLQTPQPVKRPATQGR